MTEIQVKAWLQEQFNKCDNKKEDLIDCDLLRKFFFRCLRDIREAEIKDSLQPEYKALE
jgi:hypothetical protein